MTHLTLLLTLAAPAAGVELETLRRGDLSARAAVRVAEKGHGPGRGAVVFTVTVEGPDSLQVEGPRLEDALAAWRIGWQTSSWSSDQPGRGEIIVGLAQIKPGAAPIPGLRLRVRAKPGEAWQDIAWLDPLHEPRDVAPIVDLPPRPAFTWRNYLIPGASVAIALLVLALVLHYVRHRLPDTPSVTASRRALSLLGDDAGVEQVTAALRGFFHEQGAQPTSRLTSAELLSLLSSQPDFPTAALAQLRQVLELGDLVKFAGHTPSAEETSTARLTARNLIESLATWPTGENSLPGELR